MKKTALLFSVAFLTFAAPALAQPVESEPLGPAPYTMQNETDPMALGGAPQPITGPEAPVFRGEAAPATPPPGSDSIHVMDGGPGAVTTSGSVSFERYPSPPAKAPATTTSGGYTNPYPNNAVSGVPPEDPSKFENKMFCTLKISFGSMGAGPDVKTGGKVKAYLDSNTDKLTYVRTDWGREGEYSYCLKINDHKQQSGVYKDLRALMPKRGVNAPPVSMYGKGFTPVGNKQRGTNN